MICVFLFSIFSEVIEKSTTICWWRHAVQSSTFVDPILLPLFLAICVSMMSENNVVEMRFISAAHDEFPAVSAAIDGHVKTIKSWNSRKILPCFINENIRFAYSNIYLYMRLIPLSGKTSWQSSRKTCEGFHYVRRFLGEFKDVQAFCRNFKAFLKKFEAFLQNLKAFLKVLKLFWKILKLFCNFFSFFQNREAFFGSLELFWKFESFFKIVKLFEAYKAFSKKDLFNVITKAFFFIQILKALWNFKSLFFKMFCILLKKALNYRLKLSFIHPFNINTNLSFYNPSHPLTNHTVVMCLAQKTFVRDNSHFV